MSARCYLDYNASAPTRPEVRDAIARVLCMQGNPSSVHAEGRQLRALVEKAREQVAALAGAEPRHVIFTSGGTEANVTALAPEIADPAHPEDCVCFASAVEHPSVLSGGRFAADAIRHIPVNADGVVEIDALERSIDAHTGAKGTRPFMVSLMLANNETGAIQPVGHVAELVKERGGVLHCDAVQAAGKIPVDLGSLGAQMSSLSAHKIGGPQGVGALILGNGMTSLPQPLLTGGGQEFRARSGTENVAGIVGFGVAAEMAARDLKQMGELARLRDRLECSIAEKAGEAVIFSSSVNRLPNTTNFSVSGMKSETIVISLDLAGIAVSAGSSCSSGKVEQSHVLKAMGVAPELSRGAIRISLGRETSQQDIDAFVAAWGAIYDQFSIERAAA